MAERNTTRVSRDPDTHVGTITLDRPDSLNAMDTTMREEIVSGLEHLQSGTNGETIPVRAVILEGADGNFSVGADINEFADRDPQHGAGPRHYDVLMSYPVPTIAKIEGYCLGGGFETALACDIRIADVDSQFGFPEVNLGLNPGAGGVQFVTRLSNAAVAMELAMTGEFLAAEEAASHGLVNRVIEDDINTVTSTLAKTIARKPPLATRAIKESAWFGTQAGLSESRQLDRKLFEQLRLTEDHTEGRRAFADDDYDPTYLGR